MVNQTCVWSTYLCHSGPVWQKLAAFWGPQKISQTFGERAFAKISRQKCSICNFLRKKLCIRKFVQQKCHFFKYPIPKNTQLFRKYFGSGLGIAKNYRVGSGIGYPSDTVHGHPNHHPISSSNSSSWSAPTSTTVYPSIESAGIFACQTHISITLKVSSRYLHSPGSHR